MRSFTEIRRGGGFLRSLAKSAICCAVIVSLSTVAGCSDDYDDSQLRGDLSELSGRVEKLEQSVAKLNGDYTALSGIVDALEGKVYVSKVDPIADGYRITFSDGTTAEIKNGAAGAAAPVIGIDKDTDGLYYWTRTIDGKTEWLLNEENEKMPVSGVTPVMGVDAEGYWTISYDGGTTSSRVEDSEGNPVAALQDTSFFESVTYDDSYVYITLNDEAGTMIKLAKGADFYLSIKGAAALADFSYGQTKSFEVESKGVIKYTITKPDEWKVAYADGKLTVTAPTAEHASCADSEGEVSIVYFGPDNAGSITTLRVAVLEAPKIGDYLYSDGTWSDGGLISIGSDGLNPVWAEEKPAPVEGKSVVAIVCQTASDRIAQSEKDAGYTHGYAVAVRSAHGTDKVTTWWSSDVNFDCLKGAKLPSTWYENVNGYVETMTVRDTYGSNITMMPAFDWTINGFGLTAPATTSGWFLPSTGQLWDMIANLCGGDVASTMKEWQTSTYRVDYGYCSATVGYDVLARFNSTMEKIPAAAKEELVVDDAGHPFCSIWASTPFDSEAVCIVEIGTKGMIELYINWYDADCAARPILAF